MAFSRLKKHLLKFLRYPSGMRFQAAHVVINRFIRRNIFIKIGLLCVAVVLFLIGVILLFIPGPGILFILTSLMIFSVFSKRLAVVLDRFEVRIRQWRYH
ncbi:MAG: hypothetical protein Q8L78_01415 [Coxiellaceae bacterium]|nr:hypothetical protein [Coxiellaceae bacterium]